MTGGPLAELRAAWRAHPVANGEDHVEVVELDGALNLAAALVANCQGFLDSYRAQLALIENITDMQADVLFAAGEQLGDFQLAEPYRATAGAQLQRELAVVGAVENQIMHGSGRPWWLTVLNMAQDERGRQLFLQIAFCRKRKGSHRCEPFSVFGARDGTD